MDDLEVPPHLLKPPYIYTYIQSNYNIILIYNVGLPISICWFITPSNYTYKYHKPYTYSTFINQLSYLGGPTLHHIQFPIPHLSFS